MSNNTYKIEYAVTGRSSCKAKQCKGTIPKQSIRVAKVYPSSRFDESNPDAVATDFFHPQCLFDAQVRARKTTKKVEDTDDLDGFGNLSKKDQAAIKQMLQDHVHLISNKGKKSGGKKKSTATTTTKKVGQSKFEDFLFHGSDNESDGEKKSASSSKQTSSGIDHGEGSTPHIKQADVKHILSSRWSKSFSPNYLSQFGIDQFLGAKRNNQHLPNNNMVFTAMNSVSTPSDVSVVVLGQAPIPKRESASGFSYCDAAAKSWRLENCKATTRNFIKAALISKGWISKIDDADTVQEALKEVDLPSDAARDWFKATARQGVLWLNTILTCTEDKEDDRKPHEQLWHPFVEEIIRVIFNSKVNDSTSDIKGIVFMLLGKHFHGWKEIIEKIHSEIMGIVPIEFIDGSSPVLETFHNTNYLVQANKLLNKMSTTEIDWFPPSQTDDDYDDEEEEEEEEEESGLNHSKASSADAPSKKSSMFAFDDNDIFDSKEEVKDHDTSIGLGGELGDTFALLEQEDGSQIKMSDGEDLTLGRQSLQIRDLLVSRSQATIVAKKVGGKVEVELTPLGTNPMTLIKNGTEDYIPLEQKKSYKLHHGDTFLLCSQKYPFKLVIPSEASQKPKKPTGTTSKSTSSKPKTTQPIEDLEKQDLELAKKLQQEEDSMHQEDDASKKRKKTPKKTKAKPKKKAKKDSDEEYDVYEDDEDDDYVPDEDDDDDDENYVPPNTRSQSKPKCMYWEKCYRTNPEHLKEFLHPKK